MYCCCPAVLYAQGGQGSSAFSNLRTRTVAVPAGDTLVLDSLSIAPGTLRVGGLPDSAYTTLPTRGALVWRQRPATDSIRVTYRVMGISLQRRYSHKGMGLVDSNYVFLIYKPEGGAGSGGGFVDYNQLEYTGSYGRSIALGNNQDVVLNSNFNLQVSGYVLDSVRLEAAITDNTIPFQPEGNTQRLQEFDQIYIRLQKDYHKLTLGDYVLERPPGYFLNYYKRVQGIFYEDQFRFGRRTTNKIGLSGSVAKGQFARNIFQGQEGNQGPYKLTGNNGEQFFIVLAGTERVYVDNVLMERGENADYIINYNTAEVRFMPRRMISKDSRIQVEFEYQDRNYLNSLIYGYDELQIGEKWNIRLNAYSNQDAKNQPYLQNLNGDQKRFLGVIGDSIQNAFYPVIATDTFAANKVLYKLIDTVVNGVLYDSVFVYSTSPDSAIYNLSFSFVGPGRGDYNISTSNANGRVYDWIAPVNGIRNGSYAPVQLLVTPKMQQVFTLNTTYQIDSMKALNIEVGASNTDPNLFSVRDNNTHWGLASRVSYTEQRRLGCTDTMGKRVWQWSNAASYEYVQDRFQAIAPYRNVEFGRDWNVPQQGRKPDEHLVDVSTKLQHQQAGALGYRFSTYQRGADYQGYRNVLGYDYNRNHMRAGFVANVLQATDTFQRSQFLRPSAYAEYTLPKLRNMAIGGRYELEHNALRSKAADTLLPTGFSFDIFTAYLRNNDPRTRYNLQYFQRRDRLARGDAFREQSYSDNVQATIGLAQWKNHVVNFTGTYRNLHITDSTLGAGLKPEETILGRLEYSGSIWNNAVSATTLYEFGAGQEQQRAYTYVEVPAGQGVYTWNDYNGDGVQQSNEFELALYEDQKRFIRIFTPTNAYVKVNYVNYNQVISLDPAYFWNSSKDLQKWQKFASRFSGQLSLQVSNRVLADVGLNAYNPFISTLNDTSIINTVTSLSNSLFFNRSSTVWGLDYNYLYNAGKQLLTYGVEGNTASQHQYRLRWNLSRAWTLNLGGRNGIRAYNSALSDGRTYRVTQEAAEPNVIFLYRSILRITGGLRYEERENAAAYGGEKAVIQGANLELRYTRPATGAIQLRGTYTNINFNGVPTSSVAFIMLDALQQGRNYLWYMNWERRVGKGIEIALEYEGRAPGKNPVIHTGRMTVRAIL